MIALLPACLLLLPLVLAPGAGAATSPWRPDPAVWDSLQALEDRLQWADQEGLATALARQLESTPHMDSLDYSRALLGVATGRLRRRLFSDGEGFAALERSLGIRRRHAAPGDPFLARGLWLATVFYPEHGQAERGQAHGEEGLRVSAAASPPDTLHLSRLHLALSSALSALGRMDGARAGYERALALRQAKFGPSHRVLVPTIAEFGAFLSRIGEFDDARGQLARAVAIAERDTAPNSDLLEGTLSRFSSLEDRAGNLAESIELAQRAYDLTRQRRGEGEIPTVRARTLLAYRLHEIGDHPAAAAHLAAIVPAMETRLGAANPQTINARLVWIESLEVLGDTTAARRELASLGPVLASQEALANENLAHYLGFKARLLFARGDRAGARDSLDEAIRLEWAKDDALGETLAGLLEHRLAMIEGPADQALLAGAVRHLDRLRDSTRVRATPKWADLLLARARAEARAGLPDLAWEHALEAERRSRERFAYELQSLPDERALQLARQLGSACELLVHLGAGRDTSAISIAWDRIVAWRGLVGQEIARRRAPAAAGADSALVAAHAHWVQAQRRLAQWAVSGVAHPDDPATAERFAAARDEAEQAERAYMRAARSEFAAGDSATLAAVLARLGDDQALVAFATSATGAHDVTLGAFVVRGRARPRFVPLGPLTEIESEVLAWTAALALPPASPAAAASGERRARDLGRRVRARLWDPIARAVGPAGEMFVVPEGAVFQVPWLALPAGTRRYLADEAVVIEVLDAERELIESAVAGGAGLLAVGAPDFDRADRADRAREGGGGELFATLLRSRRLPCTGEVGVLPALPGARAEVENIARGWSGGRPRLLLGGEATEREVKLESPGREVIHLATHGIVLADTCGVGGGDGTRGIGGVSEVAARPRAPRRRAAAAAQAAAPPSEPRPAPAWLRGRVWLALAGANRPLAEARDENEGLLTAEEIVTLDLRGTDWVVLSACQTGVGPTWAREGVLGMRRAFHLAGARSVIASHWAVADQATREWMTHLYAARSSEPAAGRAVRDASRAVLGARRGDGRSTHPFFWAAFAATGR